MGEASHTPAIIYFEAAAATLVARAPFSKSGLRSGERYIAPTTRRFRSLLFKAATPTRAGNRMKYALADSNSRCQIRDIYRDIRE